MKLKVFLAVFVASLFFIPGVSAATINVFNGDDLSAKVASANAGDVVSIDNGTYNGDITIDKNITLKGASKDGVKVNGSIIISGVGAKATIDSMTIMDAGTIIDIKAKSEVEIMNAVIAYEGFNGTYASNNADGIWLEKTANGTILAVENCDIYAKYAIWVYGEENEISIESSNITGWAALDISNGASAKPSNTQAYGNLINVYASTLKGVATYAGDTNDYGTIVIGGQNELLLNIIDSTVTNGFAVDNIQDLILMGDSYSSSKDVMICVYNSKLVNTAANGNGSAVYNVGMAENASIDMPNRFITEDTVITAKNGIIYNDVAGAINITLGIDSESDEDLTVVVPKGTAFSDVTQLTELVDMLEAGAYDGYIYGGLYLDKSFTRELDVNAALEEDTYIYVKLTLDNSSNKVNNGTNANTPNVNKNDDLLDDVPKTGDLYIGVDYTNYLAR